MIASGGNTVSYFSVVECYSHQMQRPGYNLIHGPFGGVRGRDFICVQSLDCSLQIFEQDSPGIVKELPPNLFLSPGPLHYVTGLRGEEERDLFLAVDSQTCVYAYRYASLAADTGENETIQSEWKYLAGDYPMEVMSGRFLRAGGTSFGIVGERSIHFLNSSGGLQLQVFVSKFFRND